MALDEREAIRDRALAAPSARRPRGGHGGVRCALRLPPGAVARRAGRGPASWWRCPGCDAAEVARRSRVANTGVLHGPVHHGRRARRSRRHRAISARRHQRRRGPLLPRRLRAPVGLGGPLRHRRQHPLRRDHEPRRPRPRRHRRRRNRQPPPCGGHWRSAPTSAATPLPSAPAPTSSSSASPPNGHPISFWELHQIWPGRRRRHHRHRMALPVASLLPLTAPLRRGLPSGGGAHRSAAASRRRSVPWPGVARRDPARAGLFDACVAFRAVPVQLGVVIATPDPVPRLPRSCVHPPAVPCSGSRPIPPLPHRVSPPLASHHPISRSRDDTPLAQSEGPPPVAVQNDARAHLFPV